MMRTLRRLRRETGAVAMIEFAYSLPLLVAMGLTGAELTNYITVRMRMSQITLQVADNAARMGTSVAYGPKQINEADINDVFTGAKVASGGLDVESNGRIILSDVEPTASGATTYKIGWQRCYGNQTHAATYTVDPNTGMGPASNKVTALSGSATMFVEVYYVYKPLIKAAWAPSLTLTEIASMAVRDTRDLTGGSNGVYQVSGVTPATC